MLNYKKGDRVRLLKGEESEKGLVKEGSTGTVLEDPSGSIFDIAPYVKWDNFTQGHNFGDQGDDGSNWAVLHEELEFLDK